jgi:hypothetical protein
MKAARDATRLDQNESTADSTCGEQQALAWDDRPPTRSRLTSHLILIGFSMAVCAIGGLMVAMYFQSLDRQARLERRRLQSKRWDNAVDALHEQREELTAENLMKAAAIEQLMANRKRRQETTAAKSGANRSQANGRREKRGKHGKRGEHGKRGSTLRGESRKNRQKKTIEPRPTCDPSDPLCGT